jgi:septation ring formation regulator EzrA
MHLGARMVELEDLPDVGPATVVRLRQAGYGHVKMLNVELQHITIERKFESENETLKVVEEEHVTPLELDTLDDWTESISLPALTQELELLYGE